MLKASFYVLRVSARVFESSSAIGGFVSLQGSGIDIPDQQLTVLIRTLDVDGFINYK